MASTRVLLLLLPLLAGRSLCGEPPGPVLPRDLNRVGQADVPLTQGAADPHKIYVIRHRGSAAAAVAADVPAGGAAESEPILGRPTLSRHEDVIKNLDPNELVFKVAARETCGRHACRSLQEFAPSQSQLCPQDDFKPCISREEADSRAMECCLRNPSIPSGCYEICNTEMNLVKVHELAVRKKVCPAHVLEPFMECLAEQQDNRACCAARRVRDVDCASFCYPSGGLPPIDMKLAKCVGPFQRILDCIVSGLNPR